MKLALMCLLLGVIASKPFVTPKASYTVSGVITTSGRYCGGMAPTDEMLRRVQATVPMNGFMIYAKKGSVNKASSSIIDSTSTDENGAFSFDLPKGNYILLQEKQLSTAVLDRYKESLPHLKVDQDCLLKWWKAGMATITVEDQPIDSLNFHFGKKCFIPENIPCLQFTGPYPP